MPAVIAMCDYKTRPHDPDLLEGLTLVHPFPFEVVQETPRRISIQSSILLTGHSPLPRLIREVWINQ
jgi:hypothetical protein